MHTIANGIQSPNTGDLLSFIGKSGAPAIVSTRVAADEYYSLLPNVVFAFRKLDPIPPLLVLSHRISDLNL